MTLVTVVLIGGWVFFWVYWFILAMASKKNVSSNLRKFAAVRIAIFALAVILVRVTRFHGPSLGQILVVNHDEALAVIGLVSFLAGLAVAVWARRSLGGNWGTPMALKQDPELVTAGPYRTIRHPIYSGVLLALVGSALAANLYWLAVAAIAGAYFIYSAYAEEAVMLQQFPKVYPVYRVKTKMLVPFIF